MEFEWDKHKAAVNERKHGVTFHEASTIFSNPQLKVIFDRADVISGEERWIALGFSGRSRLLVVCHVRRDLRVRIISARRPRPHEEGQYVQA